MKLATVEFSKDKSQEHRWHLKHGNGKILAASSEGFMSKTNAKRNFRAVRDAMAKVVLAFAFLIGTSAMAQTTPPTFFNSVSDYFSSFNTNLDSTFATERAEIAIGVDSTQGGSVPLANSLRISYTVYQPSNAVTALSIENVLDNSGVAGTLVSEQLGLGFSFIVHDVKLTGYADGLYDFNPATKTNSKGKTRKDSAFGAEIGLRVQKAMTTHTFSGIGLGVILPRNEQKFQVFTGFTF